MASHESFSLGLPRIRNEPDEVREFIPSFVAEIVAAGIRVELEEGYGARMGYRITDYTDIGSLVRVTDRAGAFAASAVLVLRPPEDALDLLRPGSTFLSMLHFPTHKERARGYKEHGVEAIALDLIVDDVGTRLVENMRAVAWNGLDVAFGLVERLRPAVYRYGRSPVVVTVLGAGMVGKHAVEAATKVGNLERVLTMPAGFCGVEVVTAGRNLTSNPDFMRRQLAGTDVLVDATRRSDPRSPVVPHEWIRFLDDEAVIVDLSVDPNLPNDDPPVVRGIEGIPAGDLGQIIFGPHDPAWDSLRPRPVHRRWVVSCYSWPGLFPVESMRHYGLQIAPLIEELARRGSGAFLRADGARLERALYRGSLDAWKGHI